MGQLKPGEHVRLKPTTYDNSLVLAKRVESFVDQIQKLVDGKSGDVPVLDLVLPPGEIGAILKKVEENGSMRP
jgi:hypothetical protein